jgi:hypothetical protein
VAYDLVVEIPNEPGALATVAKAISDAGVNLAAATCLGTADHVDLHILVPHAEAARHALAISHVGVSHEREVVVVDVDDRPGVLADLTRKVAQAGIDLDLVYVATRNRLVFGSPDLDGLKRALGACRRARANDQPAGGISTRLTTWMTPLLAITSAFVTFAWLTKTFMPETRMRTFAPSSVFAVDSFATSAAVTLPATTW